MTPAHDSTYRGAVGSAEVIGGRGTLWVARLAVARIVILSNAMWCMCVFSVLHVLCKLHFT